ncbi:hypothetical protein HID58_042652, partial [Brassica napus]
MMSLGVVLNVERVLPFIVRGIVHRGSNTPSGFSTSFLPRLIGFSSGLWVLALLGSYTDSYILRDIGGLEIFRPGVMDDPASRPRCRRGFRIPWTGFAIVSTWLIEDFKSFLRSDPSQVYAENWSPEWSFTGEMRYLILLLGIPYLGGVFGVPRYLTTCGDNTCGPLARILDPELFLGVIVAGIRFSRYDASYLGLESKGLWVSTTSELARFESKGDHAKRSMLGWGEFLGLLL